MEGSDLVHIVDKSSSVWSVHWPQIVSFWRYLG